MISKLWQETQINYGLNVTVEPLLYPYFVYGISSNYQLYPISDHTNDQDSYLEILYYGSQAEYNGGVKSTYAALLRLI